MRHFVPSAILVFAIGISAASSTAQTKPGQIGFYAEGGGRSAGSLCSGFSCSPARLVGKPNISLTFSIRAPRNAPFIVVAGPSATLCVQIPGFSNQLVVVPSLTFAGVVSTPDPNVSCTGYKASFQITIPGSVRKGARLALQALATTKDTNNVSRPAFSSAIEVIVL